VIRARWRALRKGLLQDIVDERLPMPCIMRLFFHNHFGEAKRKRGAPPTTLPVLINRDLMSVGRSFKTPEDYRSLKTLVAHPRECKTLVEDMVSHVTSKLLEVVKKTRAKRKSTETEAGQRAGEQQEQDSKRKRVKKNQDHTELGEPPDLIVQSVPIPGPILRCTRKRGPQLTTIPDEKPVAKRSKRIVDEVAVSEASLSRNCRLDESRIVSNSAVSGRSF
jgi:hypothetical protein